MLDVKSAEAMFSGECSSTEHSPGFKDPLGVNDRLCTAVDDESDEFDFDVSLHLHDSHCCSSYL